ncbi:MAG: hypothetical protein JWN73_1640 [Betaproteobacteria bacterium]|nr:hypothetical protein [Betaproteobacteria bacterium]
MPDDAAPIDLFEHAACGLLLTDVSGNILRCNATLRAWLGYTGEDLAARRFPDLLTIGARVFHQTHLIPLLNMQESVAEVALDVRHRDGHTLPMLVNIARRRHGGEVLQEVAMMIVADRHKYEQELLKTRAELRDANERLSGADRAKDEFLATLAHELRNPLAPMHNVLQILAALKLPEPRVEWCLNILERQVGQMTHLVDDLLEISRIAEGKVVLRRESCELRAIVQAAVEAARPLIEAAGHSFSMTVTETPVWLDADPTRLIQVLQNLLNNAAKYTPQGGKIELIAGWEDSLAVIRIRDNGMGIAPHYLTRIFEKFSQVESARDRAQGGLGIGLALVRGLVELHGGTVQALSEGLGHGSEFVVRLPAFQKIQKAAPLAAAAGLERPRKILVVDDNVDIVESIAMLLEMRGHDVQTACDGETAIAQARGFGPEVVLLDIGLPDMDGYAVARAMRGEPWGKTLLLVAVTGWGQRQDKAAAAEAGFDHHLTKPLSLADLTRILG